jgi:predicted pyridoxine 5'-phosphate oxidase superfamily flavin-nucleotide-binding protein
MPRPLYSHPQRELQDRFDTRRLADRIEQRLVRDVLAAGDVDMVTRADMFFLATVDAGGRPTCSYKGGDPGFVRVLDERTLCFPLYDGNGMFLSAGNMDGHGQVGLLFIDFEQPRRLRVQGTAELLAPDAITPAYHEAILIVRVAVERVFPNCPRYIHRRQPAEPSPYCPRPDVETPAPAWKSSDWACDVLPRKP